MSKYPKVFGKTDIDASGWTKSFFIRILQNKEKPRQK